MATDSAGIRRDTELLVRSIGLRPPVDPGPLRDLYDAKKYTDLIGHMRNSLSLDIGLRIAYVTHSGPYNAPAWIIIPRQIPMYGTEAFKRTTLTIFFRKSFIRCEPFECVIGVIAHELSHIVLSGLNHPLKWDERAVDLTAMVLGYRYFIPRMEYTSRLSFSDLLVNPKRFFSRAFHTLRGIETRTRFGYLKSREAKYALWLIEKIDAKNEKPAF